MKRFKHYIAELTGKDKIPAIRRHHSDRAEVHNSHNHKGTAAREYHIHQRDRASRLHGIKSGRIKGTAVKHNLGYNRDDRAKAHAAKAKIKDSDYKKD